MGLFDFFKTQKADEDARVEPVLDEAPEPERVPEPVFHFSVGGNLMRVFICVPTEGRTAADIQDMNAASEVFTRCMLAMEGHSSEPVRYSDYATQQPGGRFALLGAVQQAVGVMQQCEVAFFGPGYQTDRTAAMLETLARDAGMPVMRVEKILPGA